MIFLIFYWLYVLQTAVSYYLIGPFFLFYSAAVVFFYFQFYIFLIFLTQLSETLPHYSQNKNLYFLILLHNILSHW